MSDDVVLTANNLSKHYKVSRGRFRGSAELKALDGVSFTLKKSKTLAIVGESGCGKSTLARLVTMIENPTAGQLNIAGTDIVGATADELKNLRPKVQIVFQNPFGSLNPRQKIGSALEEPLLVSTSLGRKERREKAQAMMAQVGLQPEHYDRFPHMFSGGQRQRIAIARALMLEPDILVLDEPVSALDISIQAQVLNLLRELQERLGLAYLFISHDLSVVKHIADEVMVMYLGRPVEYSPRKELFASPLHPYTQALLSATPSPEPGKKKQRIVLTGELPSPIAQPSGCAFHPRCSHMIDLCKKTRPQLRSRNNCKSACHVTMGYGENTQPSDSSVTEKM